MSLTVSSLDQVPVLMPERTQSIIRNLTRLQGLIRQSPGIRLKATTRISGLVQRMSIITSDRTISVRISSKWEQIYLSLLIQALMKVITIWAQSTAEHLTAILSVQEL